MTDEEFRYCFNFIKTMIKCGEMNGNKQPILCIEEMSELTKELTKMIRKNNLEYLNKQYIFEEACDVICTIIVFLQQYGLFNIEEIIKQIKFKMDRALNRYKNTGKI